MLTRFAPSPTGFIHPGNVRTALVAFLYSKSCEGEFILRIDDTDVNRSQNKYVDAIKDDLSWLGIHFDHSFNQSSRLDRYNEIINKLKRDGRIYACYESPEELEAKRKIMRMRGKAPVYRYSDSRIKDSSRQPHYRFRLIERKISWKDDSRGVIEVSTNHTSDPIVIRADGTYTYLMPSVIDDIDFKITHIIRGEDHISNTAVQIDMIDAIGNKIPNFAHISLLHAKDGKFSKRSGNLSIREIRDMNIESMTLCSYLARLGTSNPIEVFTEMKDLVRSFDINAFSASQASFDINVLKDLNAKLMQKLDSDYFDLDPDFWNVISSNINNRNEIMEWHEICYSDIKTVIVDNELVSLFREAICSEKWDKNIWFKSIEAVKNKTQLRGKNLFLPIRQALTGKKDGPEMHKLLYLIGKERALKRLS